MAHRRSLTRRQLLRGTVLGAAGLGLGRLGAACGDGRGEEAQLVALFSPAGVLAAGIEQRIPFGLIDQGVTPRHPGRYPVRILRDGRVVFDTEVQSRLVAHDHPAGDAGQPHEHAAIVRYYAVRANLAEPGIYDLELDVDGRTAALAFQLFDPADVTVPLPGQPLPPVRVPTFQNPLGVDPICTRFAGPCPLHDRTVDEVLDDGAPLCLLVATPAYCATAYCGPVLDVLLDTRQRFPDVGFLHAEVYENAADVDGNLLDPELRVSPVVADLGLDFEPSLFVVDADRTIRDRIDNVYDADELRTALALV